MKTYKVVKVTAAETFETSLNELSQAGWKVVNANLVFANDTNNTPTYFALLENTPLEDELKQMVEENPEELLNDMGLSPSSN
ncbi:hypothetical protein FVR03_03915 [Pontibacter qinzhouensis]|uniref:DUF4177 domain-containing protein n=1 Tax=Pontibacter qinzhouensis TaxID=2603253 RepID=A0A5C8KBN3_9BACT|nr:hypothetical protein [Pontibacter qinzhouensis]TXK50809.1 hypothetical protein FVR03_03915 [Pontibacter qinzhouensis]